MSVENVSLRRGARKAKDWFWGGLHSFTFDQLGVDKALVPLYQGLEP